MTSTPQTSPNSRPSPSSSPCPDQDLNLAPPPVLLNLDHHLLLLSIQEGASILSELQAQRLAPSLSQALHQVQLRLTYFLLHFPAPDYDKTLAAQLHRESLDALASRLVESQTVHHNSTHFLNRIRNR